MQRTYKCEVIRSRCVKSPKSQRVGPVSSVRRKAWRGCLRRLRNCTAQPFRSGGRACWHLTVASCHHPAAAGKCDHFGHRHLRSVLVLYNYLGWRTELVASWDYGIVRRESSPLNMSNVARLASSIDPLPLPVENG